MTESFQPAANVFDPAAAGWTPYTDDGFVGLVGPFWVKQERAGARYAFLAEPKHHNRRNVVQGGMLMTFADRSMGMTAWETCGRPPLATVQLDVHFVGPVRIGDFVEASCVVVRRTRTLIFMSASLLVREQVVATANGVWKELDPSGALDRSAPL